MTKSKLLRMDNVSIVVDDMNAAVAFFKELGLEVEGKATVEGKWVDQVVGLEGLKSDIVVMHTPDGHSKLELTRFHTPQADRTKLKNASMNILGLHRVMFAVTDLKETISRLENHGAKLIGEVVQFENMYLLCYLRGPADIIVALAEQLGDKTVKDVLN